MTLSTLFLGHYDYGATVECGHAGFFVWAVSLETLITGHQALDPET